ncbi:hypothetical protein ZIOFF_001648 [Zingiber officinale]|uniref:XS domain-containing protein n=1 Tax=Zingiber officinale TaxID=94328 RepID=A0A8J5IA77_ZINOF|nr:hypothetical protein ZIOFF_001648 [Zingiber officinale]
MRGFTVASVEAVADGRRCTSPVGRRWRNNGAREGDSLTEDQVAPVVREGGHGASIIRVRGWSSGVSGRCEGATTVSRMADNTACMGQGAEKRGGDLRSRRQKADDGDGGEGREAVASKQRWRGRPCGQACACRKENAYVLNFSIDLHGLPNFLIKIRLAFVKLWLGMGNQELLDYFSTYAAVKARHSYGPNGHRGMSVLVFEASAMGYLEAERLHKHFAEQGTSRGAWEHPRRNLFSAGGKRQLYGYLARKEDLDTFNYHCQGKSQLKYELKSYQEMVVISMKQMNLDNQQLVWLKNEFVKKEKLSKTVEETFGMLTQKLRETMEENRIVRLRTKIQHQENKEEMDYQEHFFKEQMDKIHSATEEKERLFEKLQQEECAKAKHSDLNSGTTEEKKLRKEEIARFINNQAKGVEEFEAERDKLIKVHEEKKVELRRRYLEEEVKLEKEFDDALTKLMEKYSPATFQASRSSS